METKSTFTVTLISNGSESYYPNNTLTQFTNRLQNDIILDNEKDWCVTLQDCGIHLNYENLAFPKDVPILISFDGNYLLENLGHAIEKVDEILHESVPNPSSYQVAFERLITNSLPGFHLNTEELKIRPQFFTIDFIEDTLNDFISKSDYLKNYLTFNVVTSLMKFEPYQFINEDSSISITGLKSYLTKNPTIRQVKIHQARFKNSYKLKSSSEKLNSKQTIGLCIHDLLYSALDFSKDKKVVSIEINKQSYHIILLQPEKFLTSNFLFEKEFPRLATNICHVHCNLIKPYNFNDKYCQIIRTVSLPRTNAYYFSSVKAPQYYKLNSKLLKSIDIKITNDALENLPLLPGVPSIIKLKFEEMEQPKKISNLKVTSTSKEFSNFDNTNNHFRIQIPSNLHFNEPNLQMSVAGISYPNRFKSLPNLNQNKNFFVFNLSLLTLDIEKQTTIPISNFSFRSPEDMLQTFNLNLSKESHLSAVFKNTFNSTPKTKFSNTHHCKIQSSLYSIIALPVHLCILLGIKRNLISLNEDGEYHWENSILKDHVYMSSKIERISRNLSVDLVASIQQYLNSQKEVLNHYYFICLSPNDTYYFYHEMNIHEFRPKYFLLYNNICEYSIFDTKYLKILKIVPVKESDSEYVTIEFENDEYVGVQISHPNYLEFILRSHTGQLIDFEKDDENVIIDLKFKIQE